MDLAQAIAALQQTRDPAMIEDARRRLGYDPGAYRNLLGTDSALQEDARRRTGGAEAVRQTIASGVKNKYPHTRSL